MNDEPLSEEGQQRRQQILLLAKAEGRRRRQKRLVWRGAAILAIGAMTIPLMLHRQPRLPMPIEKPEIAKVSPPVPAAPAITIEYVQTDPTITDRLTIKPQPPRWTSIDDDEFLKELADAGQPAGIAYINGKAILLSRADTR